MEKSCSYRFRDGESCNGTLYENSEFCFWHDPNADKKNPNVKEDIERKYNNGERLEGFILEEAILDEVHLIKADLRDVSFKRASLVHAHMYGADLCGANLFKADLNHAILKDTKRTNTELLGANLEGADLGHAKWHHDTRVKNEIEADTMIDKGDIAGAVDKYREAEDIYRSLKNAYKDKSLSTEAGIFFHREMTVRRKQLPRFSLDRLWSWLIDVSTAYGEKPQRIVSCSLTYCFAFALLYCVTGATHSSGKYYAVSSSNSWVENADAFYNAFYYSVTTFTTLGYGDITPIGVGKLFAVFEAFTGAFMIALFVVTVYKSFMER